MAGLLIENKIDFINIDINPPKNIEHQSYWQNMDIINYTDLVKILRKFKPSHILHLAADLGMDHNNFDDLQCNILGVENLIKAANSINSIERIVFTSSLLVCRNGYVPINDIDYSPPNFYGKSKVIGEKKIRSSELNCQWAIVRPTSIWGPWFDYSYKTFFQTIDKNRYMHLGKNEFQKPASFVGNTVHMLMSILLNNSSEIDKSTFYIADYPCYSTKKWAIEIQKVLNSKKIKTAPLWVLRIIALLGDIMKKLFKFDPPLTSFRLNNMLTGGDYPLKNTRKIVGELPYNLNESVYITAKWMYKNNLIKNKPIKV